MKDLKAHAHKVLGILKKTYPKSKIALDFGDTFQLLVAVILSAQCTDVRVNKITPALFKKYPTVKSFSSASLPELEQKIYSTGFYKNKAKNIKGAAQKVIQDFNGKVPDNMVDLLKLPGVARKTANVILSVAYGKNEGIVVDTHVARISGLLGLCSMKDSKSKNAVRIEKDLMGLIPRKDWGRFSFMVVDHGRKICVARKPKCRECSLNKICPSAKV